MIATDHLLVGNSFPLSLIRRFVCVRPRSREEWLGVLSRAGCIYSYWGHANTLSLASEWAGVDLRPRTVRPALHLDANGRPMLNGESFSRCWVLSPDYAPDFRPQEGQIVPPEAILGWQALEITWDDDAESTSATAIT